MNEVKENINEQNDEASTAGGTPKQTFYPLKEALASLVKEGARPLAVPFGVSEAGGIIFSDLALLNHILIGGTTASGKSNLIHSMLLSLISRNAPEGLRLVLIDPKMVEFSCYDDVPNLICPIVTDCSCVKTEFERLLDLMNERINILSIANVTTINEYNNIYAAAHVLGKLPSIVVAVDEFADLICFSPDVLPLVIALAKKSNQVGIHLIIASQRVDSEIFPKELRECFMTKVCLRVQDEKASSLLLGQKGGEELLGQGDTLVVSPVFGNSTIHCQGYFASLGDLKFLSKTHFNKDAKQQASSQNGAKEASLHAKVPSDGVYESIKAAVLTLDSVSVSLLQSNFSLGFPKASSILKRLINEGVVSASPDGRTYKVISSSKK